MIFFECESVMTSHNNRENQPQRSKLGDGKATRAFS